MSIGNTKDQGNKGNNFPYQLSNLQLLADILKGVTPLGGLATESTALNILSALQSGQSFVQNIVIDLGGVGCPTACPTYLEVKIWNGTGFDPSMYYDADGAAVTPVGPLEYVNPQFVLQQILTQATAINATLDVDLSTRNAEATQLLIKALLTTIDADTSNIDVPMSTVSKESTQLLVKAVLDSIKLKTDNLDVALSTVLSNSTFTTRINTLGQKTSAASTPVVLPSDQIVNVNIGASAMSIDAFGRNRVSEPYTLGDYKHLYGLDPNFLDVVGNGGSISFQPNQACARLATTTSSNSFAIHQTKFYHQYMPGKSQLIISSFNLYTAVPGVIKRTGYFDNSNGVFFQQDGDGTLKLVIRTDTSGSAIDAEVKTQAQWNVDKCNGTGASGFNLQIDQTQIFFIELQWLGVGRVRCGFVHNGNYVVAHEFFHDNILPVVYMSNPNLPVRCEIESIGSNPAAYFDQICSTVISEGGYVESGQDWAYENTVLRSVASGATLPVFAIRLKNSFNTYQNRIIARLSKYQIFSTNQPLSYRVVKLPSSTSITTGASWIPVDNDSGIEYNVGAAAISGGEILDAGYVAGSNAAKESLTQVSNPTTAKKNYIVQNFDSTNSEIYVIVVTNLGSNSTDVGVSMQWREIY